VQIESKNMIYSKVQNDRPYMKYLPKNEINRQSKKTVTCFIAIERLRNPENYCSSVLSEIICTDMKLSQCDSNIL
jgi:hypothetical protein